MFRNFLYEAKLTAFLSIPGAVGFTGFAFWEAYEQREEEKKWRALSPAERTGLYETLQQASAQGPHQKFCGMGSRSHWATTPAGFADNKLQRLKRVMQEEKESPAQSSPNI